MLRTAAGSVRMGFPMSNPTFPRAHGPGDKLPFDQAELQAYIRCRIDNIVDALGRSLDAINVDVEHPVDTCYLEGQLQKAFAWMTQAQCACIFMGMQQGEDADALDQRWTLAADPFLTRLPRSTNGERGQT